MWDERTEHGRTEQQATKDLPDDAGLVKVRE
jgi:hypothetical protein